MNFRSVVYTIGLLLVGLGASMFVPMVADILAGHEGWHVFLRGGLICIFVGGLSAMTTTPSAITKFTPQQSVFLSIGFWTIMPLFGMLPFMMGAPYVGVTDAFFEAMSGFTTTGATVFTELEGLSPGVKLWRAMTQWYGGIGIVIATMIFFPDLRIGGMQIFRSEIFENENKSLPRLIEVAKSILFVYLSLTALCAVVYALLGMGGLDAVVHAMTTLATGGFSNSDASFIGLSAPLCYAASLFMVLAALPFIRYMQIASEGSVRPLLRDPQIKMFIAVILCISLLLVIAQFMLSERAWEPALRHALFNAISLLSGTGYVSDDYNQWGGFGVLLLFFAGLIGGCAGSTTCSIKVFRYQILIISLYTQIRKMHWPNGIFPMKYNGKKISDGVVNSVAVFFILFLLSLIFLSILLALTGLDYTTAISGAAATLANIGPGFGDHIGPTGNYSALNSFAKWLLILGMLIGRLEMIAVYVLFIRSFWRN